MPQGLRLKLQATQFLKGTGVLDGYEAVIEKLITQGWPSNKNIFDHAAYELLKWHSEHKEEYKEGSLRNPGNVAISTPGNASYRQHPSQVSAASAVDRTRLREISPQRRAAHVLQQTTEDVYS